MNTQIQAAFDHALLARAVYMALNEIAEQGKTLKQVLTSGSSPFSPALADYLARAKIQARMQRSEIRDKLLTKKVY